MPMDELQRLAYLERTAARLHEQLREVEKELRVVREELADLRTAQRETASLATSDTVTASVPAHIQPNEVTPVSVTPVSVTPDTVTAPDFVPPVAPPSQPAAGPSAGRSRDWEFFIGGNLLNKLGILIFLLGLGFLVKYSIEHELIGIVGRVVIAYGAGIGLWVLARVGEKRYPAYSAVLTGGGLAALYLTTFLSSQYYDLIPRPLAFGIMLALTGLVFYEALRYDRQVVALIGLVAAYAIPLLLSDGSGRVEVLLGYVALLNVAIMFLAFRKDWHWLNLTAFGLTWLGHVALWIVYEPALWIKATFTTIFFVLFLVTLLAYAVAQRRMFREATLFAFLLHAVLGFVLWLLVVRQWAGYDIGRWPALLALAHAGGYALLVIMLEKYAGLRDRSLCLLMRGLVFGALAVAAPLYRADEWVLLWWAAELAWLLLPFWQRDEEQFFYNWLAVVMAVVLAVGIPVYLDGKAISLAWMAELVLLAVSSEIARQPLSRQFGYIFSTISFIGTAIWLNGGEQVLAMAGHALLTQLTALRRAEKEGQVLSWLLWGMAGLFVTRFWWEEYAFEAQAATFLIFLNPSFGYSVVFVGMGAGGWYAERRLGRAPACSAAGSSWMGVWLYLTGYGLGMWEWSHWFMQAYHDHAVSPENTMAWLAACTRYTAMWLIAFSGLWLAFGAWLCQKMPLSLQPLLAQWSSGVLVLCLLVWHVLGLAFLGDVRRWHFAESWPVSGFHVRWVVYGAIGLLLWVQYHQAARHLLRQRWIFHLLAVVTAWLVLSSEVFSSYAWYRASDSAIVLDWAGRMGLTAAWGLYSLLLIMLGIWQKRRAVRIAGFGLSLLTLAKLFVYDIHSATTLSKILLFIGGGLVLLLASFLYQRFRSVIFEKEDEELGDQQQAPPG